MHFDVVGIIISLQTAVDWDGAFQFRLRVVGRGIAYKAVVVRGGQQTGLGEAVYENNQNKSQHLQINSIKTVLFKTQLLNQRHKSLSPMHNIAVYDYSLPIKVPAENLLFLLPQDTVH